MLSKEILNQLRYSSYWQRPYTHDLDVLVRNLELRTKESKKVLALKHKLEKSESTNKKNVAPSVDHLTKLELFQVVLLIPRLLSITTNYTTTSASSR
ncbi:29712_t:CDS:2, partial [Racocetra persica]